MPTTVVKNQPETACPLLQYGFIRFFSSVAFCWLSSITGAENPSVTNIDRLSADLRYLSSDELSGRDVGTLELEQAAQFIGDRLKQLGLRVDLFGGTPYQTLTVDSEYKLDSEGANYLRFRTADTMDDLSVSTQYNPLAIGKSQSGNAPLAFLGYGISANDQNYDDYANIDTKDKAIIVLRKEPSVEPFGKPKPSPHAYFSTKSVAAAAHRAVALIVVNDRMSVDDSGGKDQLLHIEEAGKQPAVGVQIPVFFAERATIDAVLRQSLGRGIEELERRIESTGRPSSMDLPKVQLQYAVHLKREKVEARNVLAELPGIGDLANQTVILGAHYDHVGMGGIGSLAPGTVAVHNGADDNASGTAVLLEVARRLSERIANREPRRRIGFIAFTGEERGLLGSQHYVRAPRWPLDNTVAMVNLDMVGRLVNDRLTVYGTGTGTGLVDIVRKRVIAPGLRLDEEPSGFGPSDHQSFYEYQVPVLHFFTGLHNDYHRPSDDFDKINLTGLSRITDTVTEVVWDLAARTDRPVYLSTKKGVVMREQPQAVLGVKLERQHNRSGVTISGVVEGSAAEKAGLRAGDRIVEVNDTLVENPKKLQELVVSTGVGQMVRLRVDRDGEMLDLRAELASGPESPRN